MRANKAPSSDRTLPCFFHANWEVVGSMTCDLLSQLFYVENFHKL